MFKKVDPKLDLPSKEEEVLAFWQENNIFQQTLDKEAPKGNFVFFEGPPTANGTPGIHHVIGRSFKDLITRYKTMQGYHVKRKAGWDTHGLPVELQVEKELGISGKGDIENLVPGDKKASIEKFNKLCQESVWKFKSEWEKLTERMAYWVDMSDPYVTYDPKYIESVWWVIGEIDKKGLLYKGHKIVPYCPRCGTALSSHEVAQGYKKVKEESVYVLMRWLRQEVETYFVVWTTTPWTLAGNAALAFGPDVLYVIAEKDGKRYVVAKNRINEVLGSDYRIILGEKEDLSGSEIAKSTRDGSDYEPLYPEGQNYSEAGDKVYKLITADYVSDTDGTGIVHIAPAFGADDYTWGFQKNGIKVLKTVDEKGTELAGAGKGSFVKDADEEVKIDLEKRGILFKKELTEHDYPFCWRCATPLLYFAKDSWYIAMSKLRDELIKNNEAIKWNPEYIKKGRFGNWLENIEDWALSRDRYWGTPLPVWECEKCNKYKVVTSLNEVGDIEPHRPYIDEPTFSCECGGVMKRTPEVMDVWFDSGAMPFAQYHYPFENKELFESQYPADYIAEAIDQTRGWFYTLLAISTLVKGNSAYKNVICYGHVLDGKGKKMSKSLGNIVNPDEAFAKYGADVVRHFFYSVNQPGDPKLFSDKEVMSVQRNLFMTLWNVYSFFSMYASIDGYKPSIKLTADKTNQLDKWIIAKFVELANQVTKSLDDIDPYKPSNLIIEFVGELSTWYVRRSRRRFWKSESDTDKQDAYDALYYILIELSKLLAPFTPMFAENIYQGLRQDNDLISVHLCSYPVGGEFDKNILDKMALVRSVVEKGLSKRAEAGIKVRQPLQSLHYDGGLSPELEEIIAEEVNVKEVKSEKGIGVKIDLNISEELKIEGIARDMIRNIQSLRKKSGFNVEDRITINFETDSELLNKVFDNMGLEISKETLAEKLSVGKAETEGEEIFKVEGVSIWVGISRANRE